MKVAIFKAGDSVAVLYCLNGGDIEELARRHVSPGEVFFIVDAETLPAERFFRDAWRLSGSSVVVDVQKAKTIAHERRREARAAEFAPLDIEATIPAKAAAAEVKRQKVRDKYALVQVQIDQAQDVEGIKSALEVADDSLAVEDVPEAEKIGLLARIKGILGL